MNKRVMQFMAVLALALALTFTAGVNAADVTVKISGEGVVDDSTIQAGKPFSIDIYWENDKAGRRGFTTGFRIYSEDIEKITHVPDEKGGLSEAGDVKGHNGWEDKSVWDFNGVWSPLIDWDGVLPEQIGFGGVCVKKDYAPHETQKVLSIDLQVDEPGTLSLDSAFWAPGGYWKFADGDKPEWHGPYDFTVKK